MTSDRACSGSVSHVCSSIAGLRTLPLPPTPGEPFVVSFDAAPGLYQFTAVLDAGDFNWEQLYETLDKFHNHNVRTGPWDFSINHGAIPLVPSYWVFVNEHRIGLWFFERVSLEDMAARRMRGRMAFYAEGPTTVRFEPFQRGAGATKPSLEDVGHQWYQPTPTAAIDAPPPVDAHRLDWSGLHWRSASLEVDPEDALEPLPAGLRDARFSPAAQWQREAFWAQLRAALQDTHACYREPLARTAAWFMKGEVPGPDDIVSLLTIGRLGLWSDALPTALATLDRLIAMPAWGNPNPEGYSHNGDMNAAGALRALAWAYHALEPDLGPARRDLLLAKLQAHGDLFFNLALLNRDYWGGSLVQDHGWRSLFAFGTAALHLFGVLPAAERWVRYAIPRLQRALDAMPRDGVIPPSSHESLSLYMDAVTHYRDALLAQVDADLFDQPPFRPIIDYLITILDEKRLALHRSKVSPFAEGAHFLNRMASKFGDGRAAYLHRLVLKRADPSNRHPVSVAHGLLAYDPAVALAAALPKARPLTHFTDGARVVYRDDASDTVLVVSCGPASGYHADQHTTCPCDRLGLAPGAGHFTLTVRGVPLLVTPDGGYRLHSVLRSCLLIDDEGQYGDVGYPMSIPSWRERGQRIEQARWVDAAGSGFVRLNLQPAYPDAIGLAGYTRDFLLGPGPTLIMRDRVTLDSPRRLSWLFHGPREVGVSVTEGVTGRIGDGPTLSIQPSAVDVALQAQVQETPVVWAYTSSSAFKPFDHIRYDTVGRLTTLCIDFVLTWA